MSQFDYYERMSWAAKRGTKKEEDAAYSLLGIFEASMSLIYGEGRKKALTRLYNAYQEFSEPSPTSLEDSPAPWIVPFERALIARRASHLHGRILLALFTRALAKGPIGCYPYFIKTYRCCPRLTALMPRYYVQKGANIKNHGVIRGNCYLEKVSLHFAAQSKRAVYVICSTWTVDYFLEVGVTISKSLHILKPSSPLC